MLDLSGRHNRLALTSVNITCISGVYCINDRRHSNPVITIPSGEAKNLLLAGLSGKGL